MLLRASGEIAGHDYQLGAVRGSGAASTSGVRHAEELVALAEALVHGDPDELSRARDAVRAALGADAVSDAVAVASNFERMVRIADASGIPLDTPLAAMTEDLRHDLGIDEFSAAAHTPPVTALQRIAARALRPLFPTLAKLIGRRMANAGDRAGGSEPDSGRR